VTPAELSVEHECCAAGLAPEHPQHTWRQWPMAAAAAVAAASSAACIQQLMKVQLHEKYSASRVEPRSCCSFKQPRTGAQKSSAA